MFCFQGLAYNPKKNLLYVADTENHALRYVETVSLTLYLIYMKNAWISWNKVFSLSLSDWTLHKLLWSFYYCYCGD